MMSLIEQVVCEPPAMLFRYAGAWSGSFLKEPFLRFSAATKFNDPFEFLPTVKIGGGRPAKDMLIKANNLPKDISERQLVVSVARKLRQEIAKKFGVLCMSEVPDDILMWAHYAGAHAGCVLGFDSDIVRGFRYPKSPHYSGKVVYQADRAEIPYPVINAEEENLRALFVKSDRWRYEQEWRLILRHRKEENKDYFDLNFSLDLLRFVIVGCRASEEGKAEEYRAALRANRALRHVRCFTAERHPESFGLVIRNEKREKIDWRSVALDFASQKARSPKKPWYAEAQEARGINA